MKKIKHILILGLLLVAIKSFGQECSNAEIFRRGIYEAEVPPFCIIDTLDEVRFILHEEPKSLPYLEIEGRESVSQSEPYQIIQIMASYIDSVWMQAITLEKREGMIKPEILERHRSDEYQRNFDLRIISELRFELKKEKYAMLLVYFNSGHEDETLFPFSLKEKEGQWYLYDGYLKRLSELLLVKPELLDLYFKGEEISNVDFMEYKGKYWEDYSYDFDVPLSYFAEYLFVRKPNLPSITLERNKLYLPEYSAETKPIRDLKVISPWSSQHGIYFSYPDYKDLGNHYWADSYESVFDGTPEEALVSWIFGPKSLKMEYCLNCKSDFLDSNPNVDVYESWHIGIKNKLLFYDDKYQYVQFFYQEWKGGKFLGDKSMLFCCQNGIWMRDKTYYYDSFAAQISSMFGVLNNQTRDILFSNQESDNEEIDEFINLIKDTKNRIYVNELRQKFYFLPNSLRE